MNKGPYLDPHPAPQVKHITAVETAGEREARLTVSRLRAFLTTQAREMSDLATRMADEDRSAILGMAAAYRCVLSILPPEDETNG